MLGPRASVMFLQFIIHKFTVTAKSYGFDVPVIIILVISKFTMTVKSGSLTLTKKAYSLTLTVKSYSFDIPVVCL